MLAHDYDFALYFLLLSIKRSERKAYPTGYTLKGSFGLNIIGNIPHKVSSVGADYNCKPTLIWVSSSEAERVPVKHDVRIS